MIENSRKVRWEGTDNNPKSRKAKLELRQRVLAEVQPARVFDAFCGAGEMYQGVWKAAAEYVGCDKRPWASTHPHRFVGDTIRVMRNLDLARFNVFDFDAYGCPFDELECLLARRRWARGERGAVVLTDGSMTYLRSGNIPHSMARLASLGAGGHHTGMPSVAVGEDLQRLALARWVQKSGVNVLRQWQAFGTTPAKMVYTALVFEGST